MKRIKKTTRTLGFILVSLILALAPALQAYQMSGRLVQNSCFCCCCSVESVGDNSCYHEMERGKCGCHVSEREVPQDIPLEVNYHDDNQSISFVNLVDISSNEEVIRSEFAGYPRSLTIREIGPPLYISFSVLLI